MQEFNRDEFLTNYGIENHSTIETFAKLQKMVNGQKFVMAGGAVRALVTNLPVTTDYDLFFYNQNDFDCMAESLKAVAQETAKTQHHTTYLYEGKKIQLIKMRFYQSIEDLLDSFDYTICQLAITDTNLYCGDTSLWDLARRKLVVHKITFATASVRRMLKYAQQGFTICQGAIGKLLNEVTANPSVINSNVEYID